MLLRLVLLIRARRTIRLKYLAPLHDQDGLSAKPSNGKALKSFPAAKIEDAVFGGKPHFGNRPLSHPHVIKLHALSQPLFPPSG